MQTQSTAGVRMLCRLVVKEVASLFPDSVLLAAGWSLGGVGPLHAMFPLSHAQHAPCMHLPCLLRRRISADMGLARSQHPGALPGRGGAQDGHLGRRLHVQPL